MGNTPSSNIKFGSINDPTNSRPGYYANGKMLKYHTEEITLLPNETLGSLKKLKYGYAMTNKRVFYKGKVIDSANVDTFKILNIKDVPSLNDPELTKLNSVLGISGNKVFYKGNLIKIIK